MSHLPTLIADLALILMSASIITLLFKWLKQPLVLGYIVAGLLAGPYVQIFPTVGDIENINIWAEIGVVFLLFALGLEFSFKKCWVSCLYHGNHRSYQHVADRLYGRTSVRLEHNEFYFSGGDVVHVVNNDYYQSV